MEEVETVGETGKLALLAWTRPQLWTLTVLRDWCEYGCLQGCMSWCGVGEGREAKMAKEQRQMLSCVVSGFWEALQVNGLSEIVLCVQ